MILVTEYIYVAPPCHQPLQTIRGLSAVRPCGGIRPSGRTSVWLYTAVRPNSRPVVWPLGRTAERLVGCTMAVRLNGRTRQIFWGCGPCGCPWANFIKREGLGGFASQPQSKKIRRSKDGSGGLCPPAKIKKIRENISFSFSARIAAKIQK